MATTFISEPNGGWVVQMPCRHLSRPPAVTTTITQSIQVPDRWQVPYALLASMMSVSTAAAIMRWNRWFSQKKHSRSNAAAKIVCLALSSKNTLAALEQSPQPTKEELQTLFEKASGGKTMVTFDEAIRLEGISGVLEEGAATMQELQVIWGNVNTGLNVKGFGKWYCDVLKLYDEFLWKDAVAPPDETLDGVGEDDMRKFTDEQLLEDRPAAGVDVRTLNTKPPKPVNPMKYGSLTGNVPKYEKSRALKLDEEYFGTATPEPQEPEPTVGGRENVDITRLFREACDKNNLMSYAALKQVSEIAELLQNEELAEEELQTLWDELPKKGDLISVLAFRDLLLKIDELFEYVEEEADEDEGDFASAEALFKTDKEEKKVEKFKRRGVERVKSDLLKVIEKLQAGAKKPAGLDGKEENDDELVRLSGELEGIWRDTVGDLAEYDASSLFGNWELVYQTSSKFRRWGSVLNGGREIKDGRWEALVQSFTPNDKRMFNEYDMEEVFIAPNGKELCLRGMGSWAVGIQQNVVTGEEDLVLKIQITGVEYDTPEGQVEAGSEKIMMSPMCRTFSYNYFCFVDDEYRVMRTGLAGKTIWVFRRLPDQDATSAESNFDPAGLQ